MALLSKPYKLTFKMMGFYLNQLYTNPIRTKSVTSCFIAGLANYLWQRKSGIKSFNYDTFWAFVKFALLFGGTIPHFFYEIVENFLSDNSRAPLLQLLLIERLVFMPVYSLFTLYMLSRSEGTKHEQSFDKAMSKFPSVFAANLKYLSLLQYINIFFVPPILRVLFSNVIDFFWFLYLSQKRSNQKCQK